MSQASPPHGRTSLPALRTVDSQTDRGEEPTPQWVIDIDSNLEEGHTYDAGRLWTIYRVPNRLREVLKSAFTPKLISIGPFHHGNPDLQAMEEHKMRYLLRILGGKFQSTQNHDGEKTEQPLNHPRTTKLKVLAEKMKLLEQKARACYSENFEKIDSDEFVRMMVVDGCFVVELLRLFYKFDLQEDVGDPIFTTRWMLRTVQRDLLMLENQLPFFVLEELFKLTGNDQQEPSLPRLTVTFFNSLLPREKISDLKFIEVYTHLLDLYRSTFLPGVRERVAGGWNQSSSSMDTTRPSGDRNFLMSSFYKCCDNILCMITALSSHGGTSSQDNSKQLIHHAEELREAGIRIRKPKACGHDLLDIRFSNGVLEIPPLLIDDNTVPLFLNFVAFEQCDHEANPFFTNFFVFLDSLIYSESDIRILHKSGIINHVLGSDHDVAILLNKLGREIVHDQDRCYLSLEMKKVNDYCKAYYEIRWRNWWRNLIHNYFSSPWSFVSVGAASTLLILTFLQTFYTMYPYYKGG